MKAIDMPTLIKEIRTRMRGKIAPVVLGVFVSIAALVVVAIVSETSLRLGDNLGNTTFASLSITEMILIALIGPTLSSNAISLERERQTLDFLLITHLSPWNILIGKYLGSAGYLILLWIAMIPVLAVTFILGGVSWLDFILMQLYLILLILLCSAIGVYASSRAPKSNTAASWSISIVIFTFFVQLGIVTSILELPGFYRTIIREQANNVNTVPEYLFILLFFIAAICLSYIPSSVILGITTFFRKKPATLFTQIFIFLAITFSIMAGMIYLNKIDNNQKAMLSTSIIGKQDNVHNILLVGNPVTTAKLLFPPDYKSTYIFSNNYQDLALSMFMMLLYTFTLLSLAYGHLLRLYPQYADKIKRKQKNKKGEEKPSAN